MTRSIQEHPNAAPGRWLCNTAELSGELSIGDVVVISEIAVAVGRPAGWEPVTGPLTEDRTDEHGTHPLPALAPGSRGCGFPSR